jgi:cytochrome c oxidase subunit III
MNSKIDTYKEKAMENDGRFGVNPVVFAVWLLIIASVMLFAAFSSAYIVSREDGIRNDRWLQFELPTAFWISGLIVIFSSFFIQKAYNAAKRDDIQLIPSLLLITILFAAGFCVSQIYGWKAMVASGLFFSNHEASEISASFVYAISFVHLFHILLGIVLLMVSFYRSLRLQIHKKNLVFLNISTTYWHFLGILWIYILLFLYFAR